MDSEPETHTFYLNAEQTRQANDFIKNHPCTLRRDLNGKVVGATGGHISYLFVPNQIAETQRVQCACGESLDLTDYDCW